MADYDSGLPIRTEADGTDERVHVKIVDGTNPAVNQTTVDSDKNLHVEGHGNDPAGVDRVIKTSEEGSTDIDGVYDVTGNTEPANIGVVTQERNAASADSRQTEQITGKRGTVDTTVVAMDVSLHDEDGNKYTTSNPLPVVVSDSEGGVDVCDEKEQTSVAKDVTANHDYTVTALKTLRLKQVLTAASGKMKVEVFIEDGPSAGTFTRKWVRFNSTAVTNADVTLAETLQVAAGVIVRVALTNLENQPQNLYSTIIGIEV